MNHQHKSDIHESKRALFEAIAKKAFWSYEKIVPTSVSDGKLIEKVLIYGDDALRIELLRIFPLDKIKRVWERKLIIQEPRLHDLNARLASSYFHISDPESHIRESYKKYNLHDRFS